MQKFRKFGVALTLTGFMATAMLASGVRLQAQGPGANHGICQQLARAAAAADAAGLTDLAQQIRDYALSLGCE
jgi:hypothetical protein